ncbi:amidohydrolase family protein [Streptomyces sp. NPDC003077]|uniref:amidohydrolase family protein n=1 Tax=Streptomyces sp. NPDC003077 TaxID=3154443 RepID=UPI0033A9A4E4
MTLIIDVDSHFQEPPDWLVEADEKLAARIEPRWYFRTSTQDLFSFFSDAAPADRLAVDAERLTASIQQSQSFFAGFATLKEAAAAANESRFRGMAYPFGGYLPAERLAWMDKNEIHAQIINPASALVTVDRVSEYLEPEDVPRVIRAYNDWAAGVVSGHTDRLLTTTLLWWENVEWCVAELRRTRELGARAFLIPGRPPAGKSVAHVDYEPIWAAANELGMLGVLHFGFLGGPQVAPGWYQTGRAELKDVGYVLASISAATPQMVSAALIAAGVFERYPNFHLTLQEYQASGWAPDWVRALDYLLTLPVLRNITGRWSLPLKPSEYFRRQVLVVAQPGDRVQRAIEELDDCVVFSSDFPHPEGSSTPTADFRELLGREPVDKAKEERFFGGRMRDILSRTA